MKLRENLGRVLNEARDESEVLEIFNDEWKKIHAQVKLLAPVLVRKNSGDDFDVAVFLLLSGFRLSRGNLNDGDAIRPDVLAIVLRSDQQLCTYLKRRVGKGKVLAQFEGAKNILDDAKVLEAALALMKNN